MTVYAYADDVTPVSASIAEGRAWAKMEMTTRGWALTEWEFPTAYDITLSDGSTVRVEVDNNVDDPFEGQQFTIETENVFSIDFKAYISYSPGNEVYFYINEVRGPYRHELYKTTLEDAEIRFHFFKAIIYFFWALGMNISGLFE
jgi:hypothetical protein